MKDKRISPANDPAVVAHKRVLAAGEDDAKYLAAIIELETCPAYTAQGIRAKRNLERERLAHLGRGDVLTREGRAMMARLAETIDEGLAYLTRAGMRTRRARPETTPGPASAPRGEGPARSPKAAKPLD
ncbi:hypothetical protein XF30_21110 [Bradyrhizobium sp. SUTN9-2]|uniref:hypothetical protein n=1 Tax=Bradyrhizobium sp. SUTN9-2 TaxID=1167456 RepID=UPI000D6444A6|nr:hypothetical protein [Bradyrhizobium sp. SUTN9-2]PWE78870.1 hypothetical protein XF30_21110 [Bradyrhizobium sp. SUTN9-2]